MNVPLASPPTRWSEGLEGAAREIAETNAPLLRVLAGPGTGKSFALMRRILRLLEEGVPPGSILVCTFTRTAADDLRGSLSALDITTAAEVQASTVHGYCFSLLSRAEALTYTGRKPRPLLDFEQRFLLEDLRGTNGEGTRDLKKRLDAFSAAWARLDSETPGWPADEKDRLFSGALLKWLRFHGGMLVGELVPEALRFLKENPGSAHQPNFGHVLVDEYQDLNRAEQILLDRVAASGSFVVIGDEDQSIYSFKFAHPEGISKFAETHPGTQDESLEECRRCPKLVVELSNNLIRENTSRTDRVLSPSSSNPEGEVFVVQWPSLEKEAGGIAAFVRRRIEAGSVKPGGVLILAPRRQFGYEIRDALNGTGVQAHSFFHEEALDGNPSDSETCTSQEAFTLLTLLARPDDRVALRCWSGFGSPSLNSGAWARLRSHCEATGSSPRAALEALASGSLSIARTKPVIERFRVLQNRLSGVAVLKGKVLVDALFPPLESWAETLRLLAEALEDEDDASALLDKVQRGVTQPELPTDVDYVRVMSLHKAKGLTADVVVVAGCVEGLIPTTNRDGSPAEKQRSLEEQRRLFYVALTRARQTLVLSSIAKLPRDVAHRMGAVVPWGYGAVASVQASRFLSELGSRRPATLSGPTFLVAAGVTAGMQEH